MEVRPANSSDCPNLINQSIIYYYAKYHQILWILPIFPTKYHSYSYSKLLFKQYKYFYPQFAQYIITRMTDIRKAWTADEDHAISTLVKKHGTHRWSQISKRMLDHFGPPGRTGKQCRQRWHNHLNPKINKSSWTDEQERVLFQCHQNYGNRWKTIAQYLKGRTDNDIKNKFYSTMRKKLRKINKLLGVKNSTSQVRQIKPKVLSNIISASSSQNQQIQQAWQQLSKILFCKDDKKLTKLIKSQDRTKIIQLIEKISSENSIYLQSKDSQKIDKNISRNQSMTKQIQKLNRNKRSSSASQRLKRRISLKKKQTIRSKAESKKQKQKQIDYSVNQQMKDRNIFNFQFNNFSQNLNNITGAYTSPYLFKKSSNMSNNQPEKQQQFRFWQFLNSPIATRSFLRTPNLQTPGGNQSPGIVIDFRNNQFRRPQLYNQIFTSLQNQVHRNTLSNQQLGESVKLEQFRD